MKTPDRDSLHERGRMLEEMFFAERDRQLLDALRKRLTADEASNLLSAATGVADKIVIQELADMSAPQFLAVLGIFPMVEVAWCDGHVSPEERGAILRGVAEMGVPEGSPSHQLLDRWLQTRPADKARSLWANYVQAMNATLNPDSVAALKDGVIGRAKKVAEAAGGILGLGSRISNVEQECLEELAKAFDLPAH